MFEVSFLNKKEKETVLPHLFDLLCENMSRIDPTGNTPAQDFQVWMDCIVPALEQNEREILLIKCDDRVAGYFQYSIKGASFHMEEIQLDRAYWGSGAFTALFRFLATVIPDNVTEVKANASKKNLKSQAILEHLGLHRIGENKNKKSYCYIGNCKELLEKYRIRH